MRVLVWTAVAFLIAIFVVIALGKLAIDIIRKATILPSWAPSKGRSRQPCHLWLAQHCHIRYRARMSCDHMPLEHF